MNNVLVIGGAGFIGSHVALELKNSGYNVLVLDNLSRGHQFIVEDILELPLIIVALATLSFLNQSCVGNT